MRFSILKFLGKYSRAESKSFSVFNLFLAFIVSSYSLSPKAVKYSKTASWNFSLKINRPILTFSFLNEPNLCNPKKLGIYSEFLILLSIFIESVPASRSTTVNLFEVWSPKLTRRLAHLKFFNLTPGKEKFLIFSIFGLKIEIFWHVHAFLSLVPEYPISSLKLPNSL